MITLNQFLSRFHGNMPPTTLANFRKYATIRIRQNTVPLSTYLAKYTTSQRNHIIRTLYSLIQKQNNILTNFYTTSLAVNDIPQLSTHKPMSLTHLSNATLPQYKNLVRNLHYLGILKNTTSDIPNVRPYLQVMEDLFKHWTFDYKLATPSAIHYFSNNIIGSILSAYTFRASIMNPYLVYSILSRLSSMMKLRNLALFTPTLGWSSYLVGASYLDIPLVRYTGIDVLQTVCRRTKQLANDITPSTNTQIYCRPSEQLAQTPSFLKQHANRYNIVFFSPPYYKLEQYENVMNQYHTFQDWKTTYWVPTIQLCTRVLKKGGRLAFILGLYGNVQDEISSMIDIPKQNGLRFLRSYPIANSRTMGQTYNIEHLYVFAKN